MGSLRMNSWLNGRYCVCRIGAEKQANKYSCRSGSVDQRSWEKLGHSDLAHISCLYNSVIIDSDNTAFVRCTDSSTNSHIAYLTSIGSSSIKVILTRL